MNNSFEFLIWVLVGLITLLIVTATIFLYKVRKDKIKKQKAAVKKMDSLFINWDIGDIKGTG